jgi:hypothetical protein
MNNNKSTNSKWRHEGDKYNYKPLDPDYFKKYYQEKIKGVKTNCQYCDCIITKENLIRHNKTKKCIKAQQLINENLNNDV